MCSSFPADCLRASSGAFEIQLPTLANKPTKRRPRRTHRHLLHGGHVGHRIVLLHRSIGRQRIGRCCNRLLRRTHSRDVWVLPCAGAAVHAVLGISRVVELLASIRWLAQQRQSGTRARGNWVRLQVPVQRRPRTSIGTATTRAVHRHLGGGCLVHCILSIRVVFPHDSKTERIGLPIQHGHGLFHPRRLPVARYGAPVN